MRFFPGGSEVTLLRQQIGDPTVNRRADFGALQVDPSLVKIGQSLPSKSDAIIAAAYRDEDIVHTSDPVLRIEGGRPRPSCARSINQPTAETKADIAASLSRQPA
jgi:hypothetical protein